MEERKHFDDIFRKVFEITYFRGRDYQERKKSKTFDQIFVKNNFKKCALSPHDILINVKCM